MKTKPKVIVALSGGVDSSVACALLLEQGYEVEAVFMKNWTPRSLAEGLLMCPLKADEKDARVVASQLGIKFSTVSFEKEYRREVVDYLFKEYQAGRTPNPDILCNSRIKFKAFLDYALKRGANFVATGHYVRKIRDTRFGIRDTRYAIRARPAIPLSGMAGDSRYKLLKGKDSNKDQSYFLYQITQEQLRHCLFPIGDYQKTEIRKLAKKFGLISANKPDSQGICFVGEVAIKEFLKQRIKPKKGEIITTSGKKIGEHEGVWYYTIGQRRGIGVGGGLPYYVVEKDLKNNILIVARADKDEALYKKELLASNVHWIAGVEPKLPLKCKAKIRYRQQDQECVVKKIQDTRDKPAPLAPHSGVGPGLQTNSKSQIPNYKLRVIFREKQRAITPGQFVVFYQSDICLGGGVIN